MKSFLIIFALLNSLSRAQMCFRAFRPHFNRFRGFCGYPIGGARREMGIFVRSMNSCCRRPYARGWGLDHSCESCQDRRGWPSAWSQWSSCSRTCEWGEQQRTRTCSTDVCPGMRGKVATERRRCIWSQCCPVDGGWSQWSPSSGCSVSCGIGMEFRIRSCTSPRPRCGGTGCTGVQRQFKDCNGVLCSHWGSWAEQGPCSASCGNGTMLRLRECFGPEGSICPGETHDYLPCYPRSCPEAISWCSWESWSGCSVSCGEISGTRKRWRVCECKSDSQHMGSRSFNNTLPCEGSNNETENCNANNICAVDGGWSKWGEWGRCTAIPCLINKGIQIRSRGCTNPEPQGDGEICSGDDSVSRRCLNMDKCLVEGYLGEWSKWSQCTRTCGKCGIRERKRECESYFGDPSVWGVDVILGKPQMLCADLTKLEKMPCDLPDCKVDEELCDVDVNKTGNSGKTEIVDSSTRLAAEEGIEHHQNTVSKSKTFIFPDDVTYFITTKSDEINQVAPTTFPTTASHASRTLSTSISNFMFFQQPTPKSDIEFPFTESQATPSVNIYETTTKKNPLQVKQKNIDSNFTNYKSVDQSTELHEGATANDEYPSLGSRQSTIESLNLDNATKFSFQNSNLLTTINPFKNVTQPFLVKLQTIKTQSQSPSEPSHSALVASPPKLTDQRTTSSLLQDPIGAVTSAQTDFDSQQNNHSVTEQLSLKAETFTTDSNQFLKNTGDSNTSTHSNTFVSFTSKEAFLPEYLDHTQTNLLVNDKNLKQSVHIHTSVSTLKNLTAISEILNNTKSALTTTTDAPNISSTFHFMPNRTASTEDSKVLTDSNERNASTEAYDSLQSSSEAASWTTSSSKISLPNSTVNVTSGTEASPLVNSKALFARTSAPTTPSHFSTKFGNNTSVAQESSMTIFSTSYYKHFRKQISLSINASNLYTNISSRRSNSMSFQPTSTGQSSSTKKPVSVIHSAHATGSTISESNLNSEPITIHAPTLDQQKFATENGLDSSISIQDVIYLTRVTVSTFKFVVSNDLRVHMLQGLENPLFLDADKLPLQDQLVNELINESSKSFLHSQTNDIVVDSNLMKCLAKNLPKHATTYSTSPPVTSTGIPLTRSKEVSATEGNHLIQSTEVSGSFFTNGDKNKARGQRRTGQQANKQLVLTHIPSSNKPPAPYNEPEVDEDAELSGVFNPVLDLEQYHDSFSMDDLAKLDEEQFFVSAVQKQSEAIKENRSGSLRTVIAEKHHTLTSEQTDNISYSHDVKYLSLNGNKSSSETISVSGTKNGSFTTTAAVTTKNNDILHITDIYNLFTLEKTPNNNDTHGLENVTTSMDNPGHDDGISNDAKLLYLINDYSGRADERDYAEGEYYDYPAEDYYEYGKNLDSADDVMKKTNCMNLPESKMTNELKQCCDVLNNENIRPTNSSFDQCFALQFKNVYKLEKDFDLESAVASRTRCVCRGKKKIFKTICCGRSYCHHWSRGFLRAQCKQCKPFCRPCFKSILLG